MTNYFDGNLLLVSLYSLTLAGRYKEAEELVDKALADDSSLGVAVVALTLNNLGGALSVRKNDLAARFCLEYAIRLKETLGEPHSLGLTYGNLGFLMITSGDYRAGTEMVIKGAKCIANSHLPESNAQLVNNFHLLARQAPADQFAMMERMWSDAGLNDLKWRPVTIQLGTQRAKK